VLGNHLVRSIHDEGLKVTDMLKQNVADMLNNVRFALSLQQCIAELNIHIINIPDIPKYFLYKELSAVVWNDIAADEWLDPEL
jgi:hypothetical protein